MALGSEAERERERKMEVRTGLEETEFSSNPRARPVLCFQLESHSSEENHGDFRDRRMTTSEPAGLLGVACGETESPVSFSFLKIPVRQILVIAFPLGERHYHFLIIFVLLVKDNTKFLNAH